VYGLWLAQTEGHTVCELLSLSAGGGGAVCGGATEEGGMSRAEYLQLRRQWNEQRTARGMCRTCRNRVERFVHCADCRRKRATGTGGVGHRWTPEEAREWAKWNNNRRRIDRPSTRDLAILCGDLGL